MEDDSANRKDDHNHNYCSSGSGKVRTYLSSQLSDASAVPQPVCLPVSGEEQVARRGKVWSGSSGASKFMDSDSSSESSELSEIDCSAPSAGVEGKFTLDTTSKFRKFIFKSQLRGPVLLLDSACYDDHRGLRLTITVVRLSRSSVIGLWWRRLPF